MTVDKDYPGDLRRIGDAWSIDLWYPGVEGNAKAIEIELMHVRAADDLQIEYDFDRDGWVIMQQPTCERGFKCEDCQASNGGEWKEVAFVKAWGRVVPHVPHVKDEPTR